MGFKAKAWFEPFEATQGGERATGLGADTTEVKTSGRRYQSSQST